MITIALGIALFYFGFIAFSIIAGIIGAFLGWLFK